MTRLLRTLVKLLGGLLLAVVLLITAYVAYGSFAWRDLPVAELEARYGDDALQTRSIDGVELRYRLQGQSPGSAPVLVLIHNHFMDMGLWDAWLPQLADHFSLLRYDLSGHGLTGPDPSGVYTVQRDVALLEGLLQALDIEQVSLVGSSLGGNIAFQFAARFPDRTQALVLINSGGLKRPGSRSGQEMPSWADTAMRFVPPQAFHAFLRWMTVDQSRLDQARLDRFVDMFRRQGNRPAEVARLSQFDSGQPDQLLGQIGAPTLVLWGQDNPQLPVALARQFENKLNSAASVTLITYPNAGHVLPLEKPLASARDTRDFLRRVLADTP